MDTKDGFVPNLGGLTIHEYINMFRQAVEDEKFFLK